MTDEVQAVLLCLYLIQSSLYTRKALIQTVNTKLALGMISIVRPQHSSRTYDSVFGLGDGINFMRTYLRAKCGHIVSSTPQKHSDTSFIDYTDPLLHLDIAPIPRLDKPACTKKLTFDSFSMEDIKEFTCFVDEDF